jgi:signal transduction histidine kinase
VTPTLERVRWPGREPLPVEPGPTRAVLARTFMYLYGAGGTLAVGTLLLPHGGTRSDIGIAGPGLAAYAVALTMLIAFDRVPIVVFRALPTLGTVLASMVVWSAGPSLMVPYAGFYFWVVLSSFYLFDARWAWINVVFVGAAFTAILLATPEKTNRAVSWVMVMGALSVGGAMIGLLRSRLERSLGQLSEALAQSERTLRRLTATTDVALALGRERELSGLLDLIAERTRSLLDARAVTILVRGERGGMRRAAASGETALPIDGGGSGTPPGALVAPLTFRGEQHGLLVAVEPLGRPAFGEEDESTMRAFASSAATAVAGAKTVERDSLRRSIEAGEQERRRWARELHDQTLQGLGVLHMQIESALARDPGTLEETARRALGQIASEVESLRRIIADLRPALLDDFGLVPALEALVGRVASTHPVDVHANIADIEPRPSAELERTVYRVVQEALTNACKHASAANVHVDVFTRVPGLVVRVSDDGGGFAPGESAEGFGLAGMRERVQLADGRLTVRSGPGGTTVEAELPLARDVRGERQQNGREEDHHDTRRDDGLRAHDMTGGADQEADPHQRDVRAR